jgi:hypothetical protein
LTRQAQRILGLLEMCAERGQWCSLPQIMSLGIACHTRRIFELRKAGHVIELKDEWVGRERHVAYRLVKAQPVVADQV